MKSRQDDLRERYLPGQILSLQDSGGIEVTQAVVLDYDEAADRVPPLIMRKSKRLEKNHWHVAVLVPGSEENLPAAIWNKGGSNGTFSAHIKEEHMWSERKGEPAFYTVSELFGRIGDIAIQVQKIVPIEPEQYRPGIIKPDEPRLF